MKKKLIVLVLVLSLLAGSLAALSGCTNIITKNEQREQEQALVTVTYNGDVSTVTYGALLEAYNSYGYYYVYYYSYTVSDTLELLLNQLSNRELLLLYAKEQIVAKNGLSGSAKDYSWEALLTKAEINKAVEATNEEIAKAITSIMDDLKTEDETNAGKSEASSDGNSYTITFVKGDDAATGDAPTLAAVVSGAEATLPENTFELAGKVFKGWLIEGETYEGGGTYTMPIGNVTATAVWGDDIPDARPVRSEVEEAEEEDNYNADDNTVTVSPKMIVDGAWNFAYVNEDITSNSYFNEGFKKLLSNLAGNYKTYDYYYQSQLKTVIQERLETIIKSRLSNPTDDDVLAEYNRIIAKNKESFKTSSTAFATAVKDDVSGTIYFQQLGNYGFVRNMLLKFDDDEWAKLKAVIDAGTNTEAQIQAYCEAIASEKLVWISNPDYTTETGEAVDDHELDASGNCSVCGNAATIDYNNLVSYDATDHKITVNCTGYCAAQAYLPVKWPAYDKAAVGETPAKTGIITQMRNTFDAVNADTSLSSTEKILMLKELAITWTYLACDDAGSFADSDSYNDLGYFITADGESSSYLDAFTTQSRDLLTQGAGNYVASDGTFEVVTYTSSSSYAGIFMMMSTYASFDQSLVSAEDITNQVLPLDYIVTYGDTAADCLTLRQVIYNSLKSSNENDYYNNKANEFVAANKDSCIVRNDKLWKSILKEVEANS